MVSSAKCVQTWPVFEFGRESTRRLISDEELRADMLSRPLCEFWVGGRPHAWVIPVKRRFEELLSLPPNWDSYGAQQLNPRYLQIALDLLSEVMLPRTPHPSIVPTTSGSLQLEWHTRGIDLEVEFIAPGRWNVLFVDSTTGEEWERENTTDLSPVIECVSRLTTP